MSRRSLPAGVAAAFLVVLSAIIPWPGPALHAQIGPICAPSSTDVPLAVDDLVFTTGSAVTIPVLANDSIPSGDAVVITAVGSSIGRVTVSGSNLVYVPPSPAIRENFSYTITNQAGITSTAFVYIELSADVSIASQCTDGNCVFTATPSNPVGVNTYKWTWGDLPAQSYILPARVNHSYAASGRYTVTVEVSYLKGDTVTRSVPLDISYSQRATWTVRNLGLFASLDPIGGLNTFPAGTSVGVNWSPNAADCDLGCGPDPSNPGQPWYYTYSCVTTCRAPSPSGYHHAGIYRATLRMQPPSAAPTDYPIYITAENLPSHPTFAASRPDPDRREYFLLPSLGDEDGPFPFSPYEWEFGDGSTQVDPAIPVVHYGQHTYQRTGTYSVTLKVTDADGQSGTSTAPLVVTNSPPVARLRMDCHRLHCEFAGDLSIDDGTVVGYEWNYGDGTSASGKSVIKDYVLPGCYTVTLKVTDDDGVASTSRQLISVGPSLVAKTGMVVDAHAGSFYYINEWGNTTGNLNGILEPGEKVQFEPTWRITGTPPAPVNFQPAALGFWAYYSAPLLRGGTLYDVSSGYADCWVYGACYSLSLPRDPRLETSPRHFDLQVAESWGRDNTPTPGSPLKIHVGASFSDVPVTHWAYAAVESALHAGLTGGCGNNAFCPDAPLTRAQAAVWLLVAEHGAGWTPPACATAPFADVPCSAPLAAWIAQLKAEGISSGVGNNMYQPDAALLRADAPAMLLRARYGGSYSSPACTVDFADVRCPGDYFAASVSDARVRSIVSGCGNGNYCPGSAVTRAQMAVMATTTFDLAINTRQCNAPVLVDGGEGSK